MKISEPIDFIAAPSLLETLFEKSMFLTSIFDSEQKIPPPLSEVPRFILKFCILINSSSESITLTCGEEIG